MSDDKSGEPMTESAAPAAPTEAASTSAAPPSPTGDFIGDVAELDDILAAADIPVPVEQHGESYTDILESEVAELSRLLDERETQLSQVKEEVDLAREELSRSLARVERENDRQDEQRTRDMLLEFLDVLDDLDRALAATRAADPNPAVVDGLELVRKSFLRKLANHGVAHDPAMGEVFDPNLHEAMSVTAVADKAQHDTVVAVIREGYHIRGQVLRPAGVVVGKASG